ncbi:MAG: hypothetical protein R3Y24_04220 [Eubacteriales bacterium]
MIYQNVEMTKFREKEDESRHYLSRRNRVIFLDIDGVIQAYFDFRYSGAMYIEAVFH